MYVFEKIMAFRIRFTRLKTPRLDSLFLSSKSPQVPGTDWSTSEEWKANSAVEPTSGFEAGTFLMTNHLAIALNDITDKEVAVNPNFVCK